MTQYGVVLKFGALVATGLAIGLTINAWRYEAQLGSLRADHAIELKSISEAAERATNAAIERQTQAEARAAAIDTERTKELNDAQAENDRLRNAVADGQRRLRIQASCPAPDGVPDASGAASVDDAGTVELGRDAERVVFDLRAALIRDRAMIQGLQQYVRDVCLR